MALVLCISFIDLSTCRNIEQTLLIMYNRHRLMLTIPCLMGSGNKTNEVNSDPEHAPLKVHRRRTGPKFEELNVIYLTRMEFPFEIGTRILYTV